jgi:hypothetical protein
MHWWEARNRDGSLCPSRPGAKGAPVAGKVHSASRTAAFPILQKIRFTPSPSIADLSINGAIDVIAIRVFERSATKAACRTGGGKGGKGAFNARE